MTKIFVCWFSISGREFSWKYFLHRTSGGLIYSQTLRCTSTGPTSFQSCSMGVRHGPSARPWQSASMPSTPGVCGKFYGFCTPGTLQMIQSGASRAACQSPKRSSRSDWGFSGTWLDQLQRRTITVSSPPCCDHHLTGGDLLVVQDPPGWERLTRTFSPRTLGFTRHGGRQRTGMLGTKSSVRQRSARSSPPRRRQSVSVHCQNHLQRFQLHEDKHVPKCHEDLKVVAMLSQDRIMWKRFAASPCDPRWPKKQ